MPLNLGKVEKLLADNKFIITAFYCYGDLCRYLKLFSTETSETLFLLVSSEFDFVLKQPPEHLQAPVHHLKLIDFESGQNVVEKYSEYPDDKQVGEKYEHEINLAKADEKKDSEDLEDQMENNYKKKIFLNDFEKDQVVILKDCYRQLKRLALSLQDLRYSIAIQHEKYLLTVENEDEIMCYFASSQTTDNKRVFNVVSDLPYFYEKSSVICYDIESIRQGLYKVLDKNHHLNAENLDKMVHMLIDIQPLLLKTSQKKTEYNMYLQKYKKLLANILEHESKLLEEISSLNEQRSKNSANNFFGDATFVHQKGKLEDKVKECKKMRQTILRNVDEVQTMSDNLYLMIDKTEFDSTIMIDSIIKNLTELDKLQ